jgi:hypothetical protein
MIQKQLLLKICLFYTILFIGCDLSKEGENSLKSEDHTSVDFKVELLGNENCCMVHTSNKSESEKLILLDIIRTFRLESIPDTIDGDIISLHHNQKFSVDTTRFFQLLRNIPTTKETGLFISYDLMAQSKNGVMKYSETCLNMYGADIKDSIVSDLKLGNFHFGIGCQDNTFENPKHRNTGLSKKYWGFLPDANKFGVVYNAKCLYEALKTKFQRDQVFIDLATRIPDNDSTKIDYAYTTIVFSDQSDLRDKVLKDATTIEILNKIRGGDDPKKFIKQVLSGELKLVAAYADNGQSCCPIP